MLELFEKGESVMETEATEDGVLVGEGVDVE